MSYHHRSRGQWGRNARLEMAVTAVAIVAIAVTLVVFLLVYHDLPLRVSGP